MAEGMGEVDLLADLIFRSVKLAREAGNGFYRASPELQAFPELVHSLCAKQGGWEPMLRKDGMSADEFAKSELEAAIAILEREASRVQRRQGCGCVGSGHRLAFPGDVKISIQKVIDAFDGLHQKVKDREHENPASLPFSHDKKYVPLKNTICRVHEGLTSADGPRVVTLHGGPGAGKSTLVRYMALCYQDKVLPLGNQGEKQGRHFSERATTPFADGVFFLPCGTGAEGRSKITELLQSLGSTYCCKSGQVEDSSQDSSEDQPGAGGPAAYYHTESELRKRLHERLAEQSILIILDDVWDSRIIQSLLVPGKGLRYLITTQRAGLWGDSIRINIETPGLGEARMILLNHVVGLQTAGDVPTNVQGIADEIIHASESNPLILANLGLAINDQRATDAGEWELKRNALFDFLEAEGYDYGPVRFDVKYPRSVAASMMVAVTSLEPEAKAMLYMASLCEGPSVPENVVRVFFRSVYGRLTNFLKWADYLEDHSLVQIQSQTVPGSPVYCRHWSIHGTRRHFILKERTEINKILFTMLNDSNCTPRAGTEADLVLALCYVYVEKSLMREFAQHGSMYENPSETILFRQSIEPLVLLLQLQVGKKESDWQREAHEHAMKVILRYMREGDLDDSSIASLLELPQTASATCWALQAMALVQEQPLLICDYDRTLMGLLHLLAEGGNPATQIRATKALGALAEKNHKYILSSHQSVLETFLNLLGKNSSPALQEGAAWALGTLAGSKQSRDILGGYPGLVATLVGLQSKDADVHFRVRRTASYALIQLTTELCSSKPALEALVELLAPDVNLGVQGEAAKCLARLAGAPENRVLIASQPDALKGLFEILMRRTTPPEAKTYACMCLAELSLGRESRMAIRALPGALMVLEELLVENAGETLQTLAAMCLASLHHSEYVMSLNEPLRESLSSTAQLLMSDEEPDDNIYFSLREEALENHKRLHMQPWPE